MTHFNARACFARARWRMGVGLVLVSDPCLWAGSGINKQRQLASSYQLASPIQLFRLPLPVQTVDATPSNQLIRQYFPKRIVLYGKTQSEPKQGSVLFESTLANEIGFVDS